MASSFGKTDELNRPYLGNYRLALPYAVYLKRAPNDQSSVPSVYQQDLVILDRLQTYDVEEPFAVVITPTQDGGKYITNRGSVIKDISLSGTTAFMPNGLNVLTRPISQLAPPLPIPNPNSAIPVLAIPTPQIGGQQLIGINQPNPIAESARLLASGFIRFVRLRNLFREYARIKRFGIPDTANNTFMFFYDRKLDEWWTVEPTMFKTKRTSKSPFTYDYAIQMRTISPGTGTDPFLLDLVAAKEIVLSGPITNGFSPAVLEAQNVLTRLQGIADAINSFAGGFTGFVSSAFGQVQNTLEQVIAVFSVLTNPPTITTPTVLPAGLSLMMNAALDNLSKTVFTFSTDTDLLGAVNDVVIETRQLSESLFARADRIFQGSTSTNSTQALLAQENTKYTQQRAINGTTATAVNDPNGTTTLPKQPFVSGTGFNLLTPNKGSDFSSYDTVDQHTVMLGESIQDLVRRTTGNIFLTNLVIALNKLQFPYFVAPTDPYLPGTLKPGDRILVPSRTPSSIDVPRTPVPLNGTPTISYNGQVTAVDVTNTLITDSNETTWRDHQWIGFTFTVIAGTGQGSTSIILENVSNVLTLQTPIPVDNTSIYTIALIQQQAVKPVTPLEVRYGIDMMLVFASGLGTTQAQQMFTPPNQIADAVLGPTGDTVMVTGLPNLVQALYILSYTEKGRNPANPGYGIDQSVGEKNTVERAVATSFSLRAAIALDSRVQAVKDISFSGQLDQNAINATVIPIGGTEQVLALPSLL